jgi:hypothetical protein
MRPFTIVYSNYTGWRFAWPGEPDRLRPYLGNRVVLGRVESANQDEAMRLWEQRQAGSTLAAAPASASAAV